MPTPRRALCSFLPARNTIGLACLVWLVALATGCSSTSVRSRVGIDPEIAAKDVTLSPSQWDRLGYRLDWESYIHVSQDSHVLLFEPYGDAVVAQDLSNVLTVLDASTGALRGRRTVGAPNDRFVGILRLDDVVWSCSESEAFAYDLITLDLVGRQRYGEIISTPPLQLGSLLIFGTATGHITAYSLRHGYMPWTNATSGRILTAPVDIGGRAAVVSETGHLLIMEPETGARAYSNAMHGGPAGPLAGGDGRVYVANRDQSLYAFSPLSRHYVWRKRTPQPLSDRPVFHDGTVWCVLPGKGLTAMDARTGDERWSAADVTSGYVVAVRGQSVVVWTGSAAIALDADSGAEVGRVDLPGVDRLVADDMTDGNLYAVGSKGLIAKFRPR